MFLVIIVILIIIYLVTYNYFRPKANDLKDQTFRTLVILGSGGHTAEMMTLLSQIDKSKYSPRLYVAAQTDPLSLLKASEFDPESEKREVPRAREVKQSWISSIWTTLMASVYSYSIICKFKPDVILCNGPGTCLPFCLGSLFNNIVFRCQTKVIFVESICRVKTLSLTGKILYHFIPNVFVQWPELTEKYPRAKYVTRFV